MGFVSLACLTGAEVVRKVKIKDERWVGGRFEGCLLCEPVGN